ncbi:hypothetical protein JOD82_005457 [Paenibacillus sp. 1182]|uniref:hypothetical protein n=1 Tax=Paenibacillus sp. 1182 TaxID=2806565 RepID=UPI001AEB3B3E|nr:hypothetical protein [Paenibacillus sp. 1182]MBP1312312.1 hypothetical protein [Paenibacillus sp. 1182]
MTDKPRNWQEDMDKVNAFKHARSCVNIPKYQTMPSIETPYEPLEYWLQQYAALEREYERFQKAAMGWNNDLTKAEAEIQQKDAEIARLKKSIEGLRMLHKATRTTQENTP